MKNSIVALTVVFLHVVSFLLLVYGATAHSAEFLDTILSSHLPEVLNLEFIKYALFVVGIAGLYATLDVMAKFKYSEKKN